MNYCQPVCLVLKDPQDRVCVCPDLLVSSFEEDFNKNLGLGIKGASVT